MEGFVRQTKAQRLEDIRRSLRQAYKSAASTTPEALKDQLRRLEAAERQPEPRKRTVTPRR